MSVRVGQCRSSVLVIVVIDVIVGRLTLLADVGHPVLFVISLVVAGVPRRWPLVFVACLCCLCLVLVLALVCVVCPPVLLVIVVCHRS